jgi:hypothetical protein
MAIDTLGRGGYYVSTVGVNEATIAKHVREQEKRAQMRQVAFTGFFALSEYAIALILPPNPIDSAPFHRLYCG